VPRYVMRAAPDRDLYVEWSTETDGATCAGTWAEMLEWLLDEERRGQRPSRADALAAMERADTTGSSVTTRIGPGPLIGTWDRESITVRAPHAIGGNLPRGLLGEYLDLLFDNPAAAERLLIPFPWAHELDEVRD
jgi:hypothetical protein